MCSTSSTMQTSRHLYEHLDYDVPKPRLTGYFHTKYKSRADVLNRTFTYFSKMRQEMLRISAATVDNAPFVTDEQTMKTISHLPYNPNKYVFVVTVFYGKIYCQVEMRPPGETWTEKKSGEQTTTTQEESSPKKSSPDTKNDEPSTSEVDQPTSPHQSPVKASSQSNISLGSPQKVQIKTREVLEDDTNLVLYNHLQGVFEMYLKGHLLMYVYRINSVISPEGENESILEDPTEGFAYLNTHKFVKIHTCVNQETEKSFRNMTARGVWLDTLLSRSEKAIVKFPGISLSKQYTLKQLNSLKMNWYPSVVLNFIGKFVSFVKACIRLELERTQFHGDIRLFPNMDFYVIKDYGYEGLIFSSHESVPDDQKLLPIWYMNGFTSYLQKHAYP